MGFEYLLFLAVNQMVGNILITAAEYDFVVFPVAKCPTTTEDWEKRSNEINCSQTHGYHCVPDKHLTSLIEFCYPQGYRIPFESGHCLELAARGTLNQVPCQMFSAGCPDNFFFSRDVYKYPKCLAINTELRCFDADFECIYSRLSEEKASKEKNTTTEMNTVTDHDNQTGVKGNVIAVVVLAVLLTVSVGILIALSIAFRFRIILFRGHGHTKETEKLHQSLKTDTEQDRRTGVANPMQRNAWEIESGQENQTTPDLEETEELIPISMTDTEQDRRTVVANQMQGKSLEAESCQENQTTPGTFEKKGRDFAFKLPSLIPDLEELDCEHSVEDMEPLLLFRRHCIQGAFENFKYLLENNIVKKKDKSLFGILESRDRHGASLLHYAAKGGSKNILNKLLEVCTKLKVDDTNYFGHTVLHLACKNGRVDLCKFLLSKESFSKLLLTKTCHNLWNAAHFAAVSGDIEIFWLLQGKGKIDMRSETKNRLNVLDIACIHNQADFCKEIIEVNEELKLPLDKSDERGWNVAHFAAKVGNSEIFKLFIRHEFTSTKTHRGKTILHICCEYGHHELCELIVNDSPFIRSILYDIDDEEWNVLHSAAKGGNLKVFKKIEESFKSKDPLELLCKETFNGKTALHICCINKHVEICEYICNKLKSAPQKINKVINEKLWTAAHFVAVEIQENGAEEKLIRILVDAGIDLKATSNEKKTVLTVACEHRNINLIDYLLDHHPELVQIEQAKLREAASFDNDIALKIEHAMRTLNMSPDDNCG